MVTFETVQDIYQGTKPYPVGFPVHKNVVLYGDTRKIFVQFISTEISLPRHQTIHDLINLELEKTSNVEISFVAVARHYQVQLTAVTEYLTHRAFPELRQGWETHWEGCQDGFFQCRTEARKLVQDLILQRVDNTPHSAMTMFSSEFIKHGNVERAISDTIELLVNSEVLASGDVEDFIGPKEEILPQGEIAPRMPHPAAQDPDAKKMVIESISVVTGKTNDEVKSVLDIQESRFREFTEAVRMTVEQLNSKDVCVAAPVPTTPGFDTPGAQKLGDVSDITPGLSKSRMDRVLFREPLGESSLKDCYARALLEESQQAEGQGIRYSLQLERPYQWEDSSADPKYPCAGFKESSYIFWKNHCQKRRAQGAPQKYITFISFAIVKMICATLRIAPQTKIITMSDEELLQRLDVKFQIAQESNLLLKKFRVPDRPKSLASYELHIPNEAFHSYATEWLKELTINLERHKDLEKYNLSDVFIQSLADCKMLHDHARVLTKLPVEDLIASCSDFLQEQVLNETKTAALRKQLGIKSDLANPKQKGEAMIQDGLPQLVEGRGALTLKQARAFLTELQRSDSNKAFKRPNLSSDQHPYLVPFVRLDSFDVSCEGCGKSYKNLPERKFSHPCVGKCQYIGHPDMNKKYQEGVKWRHPGSCCSWRGVPENLIPEAVKKRFQKYEALKRSRDTH
jgi:hypothetical protein